MAGSAEGAGRSLKRKSPSVQAGALGVTTLGRNHQMNSTANTIDRNIRPLGAQIIPFRSATLLLVDNAGEPFVPMKPVVVGMGLDWKSQHVKLQGGRFKSVMAMITTTGADGKTYEMACLPLRKLPGWLMSIHASKVRPDLRENVLAFQGECDDVLWSYWNEGAATRNDDRSIETVLGSTIGTNGFNMLGSIIKGKVAALPPQSRRQATMKIWAQAHVAFGVRSAQDIPAEQLDAARNFIAAYALEGEWLAPESPVAGSGGAHLPGEDLYQVYFLARHFNSLHQIFKESNLYQHLTGLGSKVGIDMIDHFKDGSFASNQLLTKYADQMDAHQRHRRINQYG